MAGLSPMAFSMTFGVTTMSMIICTTINTNTAEPRIIQKFCPVSAAFRAARNAVGMRAKVWRYGTMSRMPMRMPRPIAMGNPIIVNPMQKSTAMMKATVP